MASLIGNTVLDPSKRTSPESGAARDWVENKAAKAINLMIFMGNLQRGDNKKMTLGYTRASIRVRGVLCKDLLKSHETIGINYI